MIIYLLLLPPDGFALFQGVIFIKSQYRGDVGLSAHERCHQSQMRQWGLLWWWRYLTHQPHRLRSELEVCSV
ncbi:hypothetical protein [Rhodoferax sp.]|uniref:hypothetical protein n=1 Tax=Rhodoferax sp. TaxID=50421 RepID=UPI00260B9A43|nr:hypothetical protein [Rhodoferax sp.]MDD2809285.1 hypothetical protein [Rhodoferax sp.]